MEIQDQFKEMVVVELASVLAGPAVGMFFAELGARVIKIENKRTKGDVTRSWKLPQENPEDQFSAYYRCTNWGKESLMLDLRTKEDFKITRSLIEQADVVISNFKMESATKLGLDYESIKSINSKVIYGSITAYGDNDSSPGFDAMLQAETGWIHMTGEEGGGPVKMPVAMVDIMAGHQLKQGILIALLNRQRTGKGSHVSISLYDASIAALANQASNWLNVGELPKRMGTQHPNIAPYGDVFYTKDKAGIILGAGTQKQFEELCRSLQLHELISDERFALNNKRVENRAVFKSVS